MLDGSALGFTFGYTNKRVLDSDEGRNFGSTYGELLSFTFGVDGGYTLRINQDIYLDCFLDPLMNKMK